MLEWSTQGRTSSLWVVTKEMLGSEGFVFAWAGESMLPKEWHTQVETQFSIVPLPKKAWWQEYLTWIETT